MTDRTHSWVAGVSRRILGNGLTSLVQSDPAAPAVAVVIHVKAGFFDEPDRWQGISHVLEHMFFKGTPTRGVVQIAAETKGLGGYLNASTSYDWTSYYVVLPASGFREALGIQADALRNAAIDAGELARELEVIIEEAKRKLDSPGAVAHETLHELLYDRHRIRRWRIGYEDQLRGFTRDDVAGYYRSRYVPERVIVSVVGAVETDAAHAAIEERFGDWVRTPGAVDPSPQEAGPAPTRVREIHGDVNQADVALGWRGLAESDPDAPALDLAAMVLSAGRGSWLYRALREPGIVTSAGAYHYSPSEVGVFSFGLDLDRDRIDTALPVVAGLMARLRDRGPDPADLDRAKTLLQAQYGRRFESVDGRAAAFASAEALGGFDRIDREFAEIMALGAGAVRSAVGRHLGGAPSAVFFLPPGEGTGWAPERLEAAFRTTAPAQASAPVPPAPPSPPAPRRAPGLVRSDVLHVALPGTDLLIRRKPGVPLVTMGLYRPRSAAETAADAGVGALAVRAGARGAGPYDQGQLADLFESLGGSLGTSVSSDWFGYAAVAIADRWLDLGILLDLVLGRPRFDEEQVERERTTLAAEVVQSVDDMFRRPFELLLGAAFGDQGYGLPVKGRLESVNALGAADVAGWHRRELGSGRALLIAVGDLDPDRTAAGLAGLFGEREARTAAPPVVAAPWARHEPLRLETRKKSQTALAMAFPGPARNDPDRHAAEVLSAVASGLGGRLFHALRDQRSLAYTVMMSSWQRSRAGALMTYIATSPAREDEARSAMLAELERFATDLVTPEELTRAVNYLAGQALVQRQTSGAIVGELADAWLTGGGLDEFADPAAGFRMVTREAIREVAARYLRADLRAEGVVRGGQAG